MKTFHYLLCAGLAAALSFSLTGCGRDPAATGGGAGSGAGGGKPVVAATIWPLASLTRQLVGDDVTVACLLPPGLSPHGFEPTATQMQDIADAKLLIAVGLGVDHWAWIAAGATERKNLPIFVFADAIGIHSDNAAADDDDDDHDAHNADPHDTHETHAAHAHAHVHLGPNPHLWLDPQLVQQMLPKLAAELVKALPAHAQTIEANLAKLQADLTQLDLAFRTELAKVPNKQLVTFHNAFDRLAERYGLTIAATLMPIETPGGVSPDAMHRSSMPSINST